MADDPEADGKLARKLEPLVKELESTIAGAYDKLHAIKILLAGGNPVGEVMDYYSRSWNKLYGAAYAWDRRREPAQIKRLLMQLSVDQIKSRIVVYLSSDESFYVRNKHPFGVFVSQINAFSTGAALRPTGCQHDPACLTDVEHTRKALLEARA